jgi:anthranilate phosphoribosyltransferase
VRSAEEAKGLFLEGLNGKNEKVCNIFSLNTALALMTMGKADLKQGFARVKEHLCEGRASKKLSDMVGNK